MPLSLIQMRKSSRFNDFEGGFRNEEQAVY